MYIYVCIYIYQCIFAHQDQDGNVTQKMQAAVPKILKGSGWATTSWEITGTGRSADE